MSAENEKKFRGGKVKRKGVIALGTAVVVCAVVIVIVSLSRGEDGKVPAPVATLPLQTQAQETAEAKPSPEARREETDNEIYFKVAQGQVTPYLTNPDSAVYPEDPTAWEVQIEDGLVQVSGTVEAKNSSGEMVKSSFVVQLTDGIRSYLEIDGQTEGEKQEIGQRAPTPEEDEQTVSEAQDIE